MGLTDKGEFLRILKCSFLIRFEGLEVVQYLVLREEMLISEMFLLDLKSLQNIANLWNPETI